MKFDLTFVALVLASLGESARILVSQPSGSKSHQNSFVPLMVALSERGHHVTYITNYASESLTDIPTVHQLVLEKAVFHSATSVNTFEILLSKGSSIIKKMKTAGTVLNYPILALDSVLQDSQVQSLLEGEIFDLVLISQWLPSSGYVLAWHFQAPFILISPNTLFPGIAAVLGDSDHAHYVPFIATAYTDRMTLTERVLNTLGTYYFDFFDLWSRSTLMKAVRERFPSCPQLEEIQKNVSLVFTNAHPVFSYPRTLPPQVIEVGAMHCRPAMALPQELEDFVSASEAGFIVFSVGSAIRMSDMPTDMLTSFINVFSRLAQNVIWQWNGAPKIRLSKNVKTLDWLPQQDLLGHRQCRLFLTHGGLNSLQESVYHGVPVLGLPMGADQELNLLKAINQGYALKLDWRNISEQSLTDVLHRLLNDPKYSEAATRFSSLLRDQPQTPVQRAVFWSEHVLRQKGANHLQLGSRDLTLYQRTLIDVYALIVLMAISPIVLTIWCIRSCCCRSRAR